MSTKPVAKGTRFRAVMADGNPLWEVQSKVRGGWRCVCVWAWSSTEAICSIT